MTLLFKLMEVPINDKKIDKVRLCVGGITWVVKTVNFQGSEMQRIGIPHTVGRWILATFIIVVSIHNEQASDYQKDENTGYEI